MPNPQANSKKKSTKNALGSRQSNVLALLKDKRLRLRHQIQDLIHQRSKQQEEFRRHVEEHGKYLEGLHEEKRRQQKAEKDAQHDERIKKKERMVLEQRALLLKQTILFCKNLARPVIEEKSDEDEKKKKCQGELGDGVWCFLPRRMSVMTSASHPQGRKGLQRTRVPVAKGRMAQARRSNTTLRRLRSLTS